MGLVAGFTSSFGDHHVINADEKHSSLGGALDCLAFDSLRFNNALFLHVDNGAGKHVKACIRPMTQR